MKTGVSDAAHMNTGEGLSGVCLSVILPSEAECGEDAHGLS